MKKFTEMTREELLKNKEELLSQMAKFKDMKLKLDMSRGKPGSEQLDLSNAMIGCVRDDDFISENGTDCRNYGVLDGLPEMKRIFAGLLEIGTDEIILSNNSSLNIMFDTVAAGMTHGFDGCEPWAKQEKLRFICPSPGYDRHFAITEFFGFELITVDMLADGPDMDAVEKLVAADETIKGIWCVPRFSNPGGIVYSDKTIKRLAALKPAAPDFHIFWDDAYCVHNFEGARPAIANILRECEKCGNANMPFIFASLSKVCFPGASVSMFGGSKSNCDYFKKRLFFQTIGPDKMNQLRHVRFFGNAEGVIKHMERHAEIVKPRFKAVLDAFESELVGTGIAEWTKPSGGYFVSFDALDGCAKRIWSLCKEAGVVITPAGATYPYGIDPRDRNIRIAPTYPPIPELEAAIKVFIAAVKLASVEKLLEKAV